MNSWKRHPGQLHYGMVESFLTGLLTGLLNVSSRLHFFFPSLLCRELLVVFTKLLISPTHIWIPVRGTIVLSREHLSCTDLLDDESGIHNLTDLISLWDCRILPHRSPRVKKGEAFAPSGPPGFFTHSRLQTEDQIRAPL